MSRRKSNILFSTIFPSQPYHGKPTCIDTHFFCALELIYYLYSTSSESLVVSPSSYGSLQGTAGAPIDPNNPLLSEAHLEGLPPVGGATETSNLLSAGSSTPRRGAPRHQGHTHQHQHHTTAGHPRQGRKRAAKEWGVWDISDIQSVLFTYFVHNSISGRFGMKKKQKK